MTVCFMQFLNSLCFLLKPQSRPSAGFVNRITSLCVPCLALSPCNFVTNALIHTCHMPHTPHAKHMPHAKHAKHCRPKVTHAKHMPNTCHMPNTADPAQTATCSVLPPIALWENAVRASSLQMGVEWWWPLKAYPRARFQTCSTVSLDCD